MESPIWNGELVVNVLTIETSADGSALPPFPLLSALLFAILLNAVADKKVT